ncbi:helix-turn-helix domain-containing protein [Streptomyces sp900105755]|uniref:helix-turn-helix domain-containing protein n=1 Tax=Streptomyces sp. 900105755 TaxID=3154389 RepID=UPI00332241AF
MSLTATPSAPGPPDPTSDRNQPTNNVRSFSLVLWVQELQRCEAVGVSSESQAVVSEVSVPPLTRPQLAEARRMRAVELFEQGRATSEVARMVGMHAESVRRWKRLWEQGGAQALRRRPATGRPPKLDDAQVEAVRAALEQGAQAQGFEADLWTLERAGVVVERVTGVKLARASVWRLLTGAPPAQRHGRCASVSQTRHVRFRPAAVRAVRRRGVSAAPAE